MRDFSEQIAEQLNSLEVSYFDEDPDGDEGRYGDGYYYQLRGEESWSGPWDSEKEATEIASDEISAPYEKMVELTERFNGLPESGYHRLTGFATGAPLGNVWFAYWHDPSEGLTRFLLDTRYPERLGDTVKNAGLTLVSMEMTSDTLDELEARYGLADNSANDGPSTTLTLG